MENGHVPAVTELISVYRRRNAAVLTEMVDQVVALGGNARLWALDEPAPELARYTRGVGPGARCELLNRLYEEIPPDHMVVVVDDDVAFARGDMIGFLNRMEQGGWDLAQPSHAWRGSHTSYRFFGRRRPWLLGRDTTFVEIGPIFAVRAQARDRFLPLPEWGMGWGIELLWWDQVRAGARIGIIDDVSMRHLSPLFTDYSRSDEELRLRQLLDERGLRKITKIHRTVSTWPRWKLRERPAPSVVPAASTAPQVIAP